MPNEDIPISLLLQNIFSYGSGIMLASYFFYYLAKELEIFQVKIFNAKFLLISLLVFFTLGFGGTYFFTKNIDLSKQVFVVFASIIAIYFCAQTIYYLVKQVKNHTKDTLPTKTMIIAGNFSILFLSSMPIVAFFDNIQALNHTLVNISLFLIIYAFLKHFFYQSQKENKILEEYEKNKNSKYSVENILKSYSLSKSETKVALLLLQNLPQHIIADKLHVATGTISKHASNIYKKVECEDIKSFLLTIEERKNK